MKNREKFREEILLAFAESFEYKDGSCDFMKKYVIPNYDAKGRGTREMCEGVACVPCSKMFAFWLDEEYVEPQKPEVDWGKVPVDTLVRVRDREEQEWILMYFKGISDYDRAHRFMTWCDGATSKTACGGEYMMWKYCELVEEELVEDEDGNSSI